MATVKGTDRRQKSIFNYLVLALFAAYAALYTQQNTVIADQKDDFKAEQVKIEQKLAEKVDNKVLSEMIKAIHIQQSIDNEQWKEQKVTNDKVLENLQELNINVIRLNDKLEMENKIK